MLPFSALEPCQDAKLHLEGSKRIIKALHIHSGQRELATINAMCGFCSCCLP